MFIYIILVHVANERINHSTKLENKEANFCGDGNRFIAGCIYVEVKTENQAVYVFARTFKVIVSWILLCSYYKYNLKT